MLSRFSPSLPFPPAAPVSRLHRCFATTADGRITIERHWSRLIEQLARLPQVALQTRHAYARLIGLGPLPRGDFSNGQLVDSVSRLTLNYDLWRDAWARLSVCDCCQSPGRFEIVNQHGTEFMQICAAPETEPTAWANEIVSFANHPTEDFPIAPPLTNAQHTMPMLSLRARPLPRRPSAICSMIHALADEGHAIAVNLRTAEASHFRNLVPTGINYDGTCLVVRDGITTIQLIHPPDSQLHVEETTQGRWVHLADRQKTLLFSFGPATSDGPNHHAWEAAIETLDS